MFMHAVAFVCTLATLDLSESPPTDPGTDVSSTTTPSPEEADRPSLQDEARASSDPDPNPSESEDDTQASPSTDTPSVERPQHEVYAERPVRLVAFVNGGTTLVAQPPFMTPNLGARNLGMFSVGAQVSVRIPDSRFDVGGGLAYRRVVGSGDVHEDLFEIDLVVQEPLLFGRAGLMVLDGFDLYAELGGGPSVVDVTARGPGEAERRRVTGMFHSMVGVNLLPGRWMPRRWSSWLRFGIDAGVGYGFRGTGDLALTPSTGRGSIDVRPTSFGDVMLRGFMWRLGGFLQFSLGRSRRGG
jgi:hypothetical protein